MNFNIIFTYHSALFAGIILGLGIAKYLLGLTFKLLKERNVKKEAAQAEWAESSSFDTPKKQNRYAKRFGVIFTEGEIQLFENRQECELFIKKYKALRHKFEVDNNGKAAIKSPIHTYFSTLVGFSTSFFFIGCALYFIITANNPTLNLFTVTKTSLETCFYIQKTFGFLFMLAAGFIFAITQVENPKELWNKIPKNLKKEQEYPCSFKNIICQPTKKLLGYIKKTYCGS